MSVEKYKVVNEKMTKTLDVLHDELSRLRAGRANTALLDRVSVDYYGAPTPITQLANISVPEARQITIQPWDATIIGHIEKAILASDIGITPNSDGKVIRLIFPSLTEERRKELTKTVKKEGENSKVAIRAIRRDMIEHLKKQKKDGEITEDDLKESEKDIQKITDEYVAKIDKIVEAKIDEIMEV